MSRARPAALVCARDAAAAHALVKGIVKEATPKTLEVDVEQGRLWLIENKYYTAEVCVQPLIDGQTVSDVDFDTVEAIVLYIQNFKGESLVDADKRRQVISDASCDISILLCDKCDESFPRDQALVWCLENDYQLIELNEVPEPTDESCPIKDHYGIDRVIHSLHTHVWSNHEPKEEGVTSAHAHLEDFEDDGIEEEDELEYMDQCSKLFSQMSMFSQNAASMPSEERKAYAEQVVMAFWKAIGGDDSELGETAD